MKLKSLILLLAFAGLGAGCTNEDLGGGDVAGTPTNELQLVFSGANGESEEYTKAIASESENKIDKLKVYLFASNTADGQYYYLETWEEGKAYDEKTNPKGFLKQGSGTSWKASIYPGEKKGLPYLKLLCVANQDVTGNITDGKFYDADGTEILTGATALTPVTVDKDGTVTNAAAATTEASFRAAYTKQLQNDPTGTQDIIHTPLLMTGSGQTKISGSVSKVDITLKRVVARFDIDNTSTKSQLTIEKVSIAQARKSGAFWKETVLNDYSAKKDDKLMTYAPVDYTSFTGANQGVTESVLYAYPGLASDESYLVIEGKFKSPVPGTNPVAVTYHVPMVKTDLTTGTSSKVAITANSRYRLSITDVTQSNIYATFEVEDWTSGGGINIKPNNDAPLFDPDKNSETKIEQVSGTVPTLIGDSKTDFRVEDGSEFKLTVAATGAVEEKIEAAFTNNASDWLKNNGSETKEVDGIFYTTFTFAVNDAPDKEPVNVHFINTVASYDPDLWTTLTFYGPSSAPSLSDTGSHSLGNTLDAENATANMYNAVGSYLTVKAWCVDGTSIELPAGDYFEVVGDPVTNGFYTSYKIRIIKKMTDGETVDITFKNNAESTKTKVLKVTAVATTMTAELDAASVSAGYAKIDGAATPYTVTTDIAKLLTNSYELKINAPQDVIAELPNGKWLKVVKKGFEKGVATYTVTLNTATTDYTDIKINFVNQLDATDIMVVTMQKGTISIP